MSTVHSEPHPDAPRRYLSALYRYAPPSAWVEMRFRLGRGMGQAFHRVAALDSVAATILARSATSDVFVGVVPRSRCGGGRADLIARSPVVWADCDDDDAITALRAFRPPPSMVIGSGTGKNCHGYWFLSEAIALDRLESINRRLALALRADHHSGDAARILRPAGSLNHKRNPPARVRLLRLEADFDVPVGELQDALPADVSAPTRQAPMLAADPLRGVSPRVYVARLTGQHVGRSGKIRCPFHDDQTPSLHVYEDPERGWYCYGCGRGGTSYDLAALLWFSGQSEDAPLRGRRFIEVRERLLAIFFGENAGG